MAVASGMMRRVLVLGSGYTSGPLVEYLTRDGTTAVTVASNIEEQAQDLARSYQNTSATKLDIKTEGSLARLIPGHNLVVSFVPFQLHPIVARECIAHRVDMVTASYVSPALRELHDLACAAGITLLNEIGLDPGIDHMLAKQCFDEVTSQRGKVSSFQSWCGGLPAPECADNPLKYKFSWSPRNVFVATLNPAKFLKDGKVVEIPGEGGVMETAEPKALYPGLEMEGYPNRDSTHYVGTYGLHDAHTCIRGTLRYKGFCGVVRSLQKLGLLSQTGHQRLQPEATSMRWKDLMAVLISQTDIRQPDIRSSVYEAVGRDDAQLKALEELRLLSDDLVPLRGTPLDALCAHLEELLRYAPGERDAVYLHHIVDIDWPDSKKERRHIDLTMYGIPHGFTAMAQTVGKPTAIAAKMVLSGELTKKGIVTPTSSDIYSPILEKLRDEGIAATVTTETT